MMNPDLGLDLAIDERVSLLLRGLFERRGFRRVHVNRFEQYDLYIENKNFLQSQQVITFMDMDGGLLALKPDMTLSVVKNIGAGELPTFQKLYYVDEVVRASRENREYRALSQIGVELVGPVDVFSCIEVLELALSSLSLMGERYVLDLSHLGFVSGLLTQAGLTGAQRSHVLSAIHRKSERDTAQALEGAGVPPDVRGRVTALTQLQGELSAALPRAAALIQGDEMRAAYDELCTVAGALDRNGWAGRLNLDFSVVNDLDYYGGLIFQGYVEGVPQGVLTGGRYDNLMKKMGKRSGALGFGISLDRLGACGGRRRAHDFDLLVTYPPVADWAALLAAVRRLTDEGKRVRLERDDADLSGADFTCAHRARFTGGEIIWEEGAPC